MEVECLFDVVYDFDLVDDESWQDGNLEYDEDFVLEIGVRVIEVQICQIGDEGDSEVVEDMSEKIVG